MSTSNLKSRNWPVSEVTAVKRHLPYGALGHYRVTHRCALVATQAANSRIFELRASAAATLIIPTRLQIRWLQTAVHTAAIEDSLDLFRVTAFTAVDSVNTVTPVPTVKRGAALIDGQTVAPMAASPGGAVIRGVTVAGAAAGMTGGTLTKAGDAFAQLPKWLLLAQPTAGVPESELLDVFTDDNGGHPFAFSQNEGFIIENRVLLGAAAGSSVYIDLEYAEVPQF